MMFNWKFEILFALIFSNVEKIYPKDSNNQFQLQRRCGLVQLQIVVDVQNLSRSIRTSNNLGQLMN